MLTLSHLRRLLDMALTHSETPALDRCERTVEGVARAYLPREVFAFIDDEAAPHHPPGMTHSTPRSLRRPLDLTDPGTVGAVKIALALALGLDPGVMGVGSRWYRNAADTAWCVAGVDRAAVFFTEAGSPRIFNAPTVAAESDPVRALCLAALHVLGAP